MSDELSRDKMLTVAKNYAKNALSARELTVDQLRTRATAKIVRRFATPERELNPDMVSSVVEEVVALCKSYSMVDDDAYAKRKLSSSIRSGKSRRASAFTLQMKGIEPETAQASLMEYDDLAAALNFLRRKKAGPFAITEIDEEKMQKILGGFMRGGFSYGLWNRALRMSQDEAEAYLSDAEANIV